MVGCPKVEAGRRLKAAAKGKELSSVGKFGQGKQLMVVSLLDEIDVLR